MSIWFWIVILVLVGGVIPALVESWANRHKDTDWRDEL